MTFSVVTYNILAEAYIHAELYAGTPAELLDPAWRRPALLDRIVSFAADVVCLQEVNAEALAALRGRLLPLGYDAYDRRKGAGKTDGCATFVRRATFSVTAERALYYADGRGGPDTGHLALILRLERDGRALGLVNTHLKWQPEDTAQEDHLGLRQIAELLDKGLGGDPDVTTWVVCGDLNATPESEVVARLRARGLEHAHKDVAGARSAVANGRAKLVDYVFHTADLAARPAPLRPLADDTPLPSADEPSDHLPVQAWFTPAASRSAR